MKISLNTFVKVADFVVFEDLGFLSGFFHNEIQGFLKKIRVVPLHMGINKLLLRLPAKQLRATFVRIRSQ